MTAGLQIGFFGKLPSLGDFASRRLSGDFVAGWDHWLQQGISTARDALGGEWAETYTRAAAWRFALEAGACGPHAWIGALIPAHDRVGRQFPLTIGCRLSSEACALMAAAQAERWYLAAEDVLSQALSEGTSIESFDAAVSNLAPLLPASGLGISAAPDLMACEHILQSDGAFRSPLPSRGLDCLLAQMCAERLARSAPPLSVFWCESTAAEPLLYTSRGLPAPRLWVEWLRLPRRPALPEAGAEAPVVEAPAVEAPAAEAISAELMGASISGPGVAFVEPLPVTRRRHVLISDARPGAALAVAAISSTLQSQVDARLAQVTSLLGQWSAPADLLLEDLAALVADLPFGDYPPVSIHLAAFLPLTTGCLFAWSGAGAVYRLRERDLEHLSPDPQAAKSSGEGSLLDLVQASSAATASGTMELKRVYAPTPGFQDRYLLCADAAYASLSREQLVSALAASAPALAAEQLCEALGARASTTAPALIVMFEDSLGVPTARAAHTLAGAFMTESSPTCS
jgi:type VI secretion system protein ImpM